MAGHGGWRPLSVLISLALGLVTWACAPEAPASREASEQGLEFRRLPGAESLPARDLPESEPQPRGAQFQRGEAPMRCGGGCAGEPVCAWNCDFDVDERALDARRGAEEDCLFCGRETGFLESPVLMGVVRGKDIALTWSPVDEADDYIVHGVRWDASDAETTPLRSHTWRTERTAMTLELEPGRWTFYVIAYRDEPKSRSLRSNIVDLEL